MDENVSGAVIRTLRDHGHDVVSVKESMPGADDHEILERADIEARVLVTHDKDFGALAMRNPLKAQTGIVLLRLAGADPEASNRRSLEVLTAARTWQGHFSVATETTLRMRALQPRSRRC